MSTIFLKSVDPKTGFIWEKTHEQECVSTPKIDLYLLLAGKLAQVQSYPQGIGPSSRQLL